MPVTRTAVVQPRLFKVGRTGKLGRQPPPARGTAVLSPDVDTSKLSHVARRRIASPPMAKIEAAVEAVGSAVQAWGDRFIDAVMREVVRPVVQDEHGHSIGLIEDASIDQVYESLDDPEVAKATLEEAFRAVDKASSDDLRTVGVRTGSVVPNADRLQSEWISRNTNLIKAQQDVRRRVERIIAEEVPKGRSVDDIRKLLEEQVGYARSRAELTARDQTLKLYGKIQQERQEAAGFTHYVWTTSLDERVREEHAELDGKVIAWDDPPVVDRRTGRREHPGGDYQCRCSAVPYTGDDVVEAEAPPLETEPEVTFTARLPEPPQLDLNAERARLVQERAQREAELARLEAERAAERARLEAEAERQRVAAEQARIAAEAERARVEAERLARIREAERAAEIEREVERQRQIAEARTREAERVAEAARLAEAERREAARQATRDPRERLKAFANGLRVDDEVEASRVKVAADTFDRVSVPGAKPLTRLAIEAQSRKLKAFGTEIEAAGSYNQIEGFLRVSTSQQAGGMSLADLDVGVYSLGRVTQTAEAQFANVLTHEYGHHVHLSSSYEVDRIVAKAYSEAAPKAHSRVLEARRAHQAEPKPQPWGDTEGAPSIYATANHSEFFAESFTAYHEHRDWLKARKPVAYKMVEDVLAFLAKK